MFQFHKGTIKTADLAKRVNEMKLFQFHKGTIKTVRQEAKEKAERCFNSIKVRLRLCLFLPGSSTFAFQFHKGTIKTL